MAWGGFRWLAHAQRVANGKAQLPVPAIFPGPKYTRSPYNRVQHLRDKAFDDFVVDALEGSIPGSYMYTRPRNTVSRESTRNSFNERAKDGFRYWLIERPKPTSCKSHCQCA